MGPESSQKKEQSLKTLKAMTSKNPYTGEIIFEKSQSTDAEIERALTSACEAFSLYRQTRFDERSTMLKRLASVLQDRKEELAKMATQEMGKTLAASRLEVEKCSGAALYFSEKLSLFLRTLAIQEKPKRQFVRPLPLGPVLAIMPWNFPYWQAFRAAIPALGAGNVMLLKHASNVSQCALLIDEVFEQAGFPQAVFQTLLMESSRIPMLLEDDRIKAVTLTGSEEAGRSVGAIAGKNLKKCVLELGGSDPFIIMPSADIELAAKQAATARTINNGQSCIAAKRFIVHADVADVFTEKFKSEMSALKCGDPMKDGIQVGPLVHGEAVKGLEDQVARAVKAGGKIIQGIGKGQEHGIFAPMILQVPKTAPGTGASIFSEEFFGPVALLSICDSLEDAIQMANDSKFGLGSSIWTHDPKEKEFAIDRIEAGQTFINSMVASEAQLPFGGVKASGFGRELGPLGITEFVNYKSVSEELSATH